MESAQNGVSNSMLQEELFEKLDDYPWYSDEEFQSGLRAILGPNPNPAQEKPLTLRARCFYYARQAIGLCHRQKHKANSLDRKYNIQIDFNAYQDWHARQGSSENMSVKDGMFQETTSVASKSLDEPEPSASNLSETPSAYPLSFNRIVELITTGQAVPGIKEIPDTVLEGQASQAVQSVRKKPWELRNFHEKQAARRIDDGS